MCTILNNLIIVVCIAVALSFSIFKPVSPSKHNTTLVQNLNEFNNAEGYDDQSNRSFIYRKKTSDKHSEVVFFNDNQLSRFNDINTGIKGLNVKFAPRDSLGEVPVSSQPSPVRHSYEIIPNSDSPKRRLPSAIIIGVKKGGTRALLEFIRVHPDVKAAGQEIHFFDRHYSRGIQWYRQKMPPSLSNQVTIEKTPSYFVTANVSKRVHNMSNSTKLIVVVRDPVTRLISDYTQTAAKYPTKPFEQYVIIDNITLAIDTSWSAVRIGLYSEHLKHWLQYFPRSQILFVCGETLIADPASELARVQDFLGIRRLITQEHFFYDGAKGFLCLKKHERSGRPHCLGKSKGRKHPVVRPIILNKLKLFYRPFNVKLYNMVGHDFGWT